MIRLSASQPQITGSIRLSGSKSLSNRWLMLSHVLKAHPFVKNLSDAEDTVLLQQALGHMKGKTSATLDIHHAGTDMRFLTALLAGTEGEWLLTGSERMKARPIAELVNALRLLGADIRYLEKEGFPPLSIRGTNLKGGTLEVDSSVSSQFISALLLVAPGLNTDLEIILKGKTVSRPYIAMTVALLQQAGVEVIQHPTSLRVRSVVRSANLAFPSSVDIESDWSSASYWYSLCALSGHCALELSSFHQKSLQADAVLPQLYSALGVETRFHNNSLLLNSVPPTRNEFEYDFTECPDIAQTLAVTCFGLGIPARLSGLGTLKVKETDRIHALKHELQQFGAEVEAGDDYLHIAPGKKSSRLHTPLIRTYNDHRMAMSFAPLAVCYDYLKFDDASVVAKSYPRFWEDLKSVGFNVNLQP